MNGPKNLFVLACVFVLTLLLGMAAGAIAIAYGANLPPAVAEFEQNLMHLFTAGCGAILALLSGWGGPGGGAGS
jgi:hypothetical protein